MDIMKRVYEDTIQKINFGEKYTLFGFNVFGFPVTIHTVIYKAYIGSYAQYNNMLYIEHKPKRKRTIYRMPILPHQAFYIWKDWIDDIDNESFWEVEQNGDVTIKKSKMSFDQEFLRQQVNKVSIRPIAILDRNYYVNFGRIEFIYQVVAADGIKWYTLEQLKNNFKIIGRNNNNVNKIELQNQPILFDLVGPIFNGYKNGRAVIRYEA